MMRSILIAALMVSPAIASAQQDANGGKPPARIRSVTLGAGEKCPEPVGDELVVCQTLEQPERIPKTLRRTAPSAANSTWASRVATIEQAGRENAGVPNSCSSTGNSGLTGCTQKLIEQWQAEQRESGTPAPR